MSARLLAIDCATERLLLALVDGDRSLLIDEEGGAQASARVLPLVQRLLADAGVDGRSLDAVAFGRGPGAFTGLRTACSVAQGLALGFGRPVLPLDSLALVAEDARATAAVADCWVAMDARMDEVYGAHYRWAADGWHAVVAPALWTLEALADRWQREAPLAVAGSALEAFGDRLPTGDALRVPRRAAAAAALARLAESAWRRGDAVDPALALPLYLRDKVALTTAEREARKVNA